MANGFRHRPPGGAQSTGQVMTDDAGSISRMLAVRIEALAAALFPNGRREGGEWRVGSLAGEPGKSLAIHLIGPKAGVWADFAAGESGDALDLVAAALYHGDKRQALAWARSWLGMGDDAVASPSRPAPPARADRPFAAAR